jgi:hypothetical protein
MSLVYGGKVTLGALTPVTFSAMGQAGGAIDAQLHGAISLKASLSVTPPSIATIIADLQRLIADLLNAEANALPTVSFDLAACDSLVASINASYTFLAALGALLGNQNVGVFAYTYTGNANALGGALATELATQWPDGTPSSGSCTAIVLGAIDGVSESALTAFLGGA